MYNGHECTCPRKLIPRNGKDGPFVKLNPLKIINSSIQYRVIPSILAQTIYVNVLSCHYFSKINIRFWFIYRRSKSKRDNEDFSTNVSESGIPPPPELPPNEKAPWINIPSSQFAQDWSKQVNNQNQSDVTFRLDAKSYHAHRYVLCSASEVFRRVFDVEGGGGAGGSVKVKVQSLAECPGWNSRRLKKVTAANINSGLVEGFVSIHNM